MEWFGELPERWEAKRTAAILTQRKERNNPIQTDFILSLSARYGVVPYSERIEKGGNKPKSDLTKYFIARENDLLVNCMNVLAGASGITRWDGAISPVYYALFPRTDDINIWYYNYIFRLITFYRSLIGYGKGILMHESENGNLNTIRLRIAMSNLNNVILPLPPREEQDHIVHYLDWKVSQINKLINAKKKQITLLQERNQAVINQEVTRGGEGWQDISLGNLGSFRKGFGGSRADDIENGVACIRYGDIYRTGAYVLKDPITRINANIADSYARVYESEVLFTLSGETKEDIGMAMVNEIDEDTWCSGDSTIFTTNGSILPKFLAYAIRCPYLVQQRASLAKGDIIVHLSAGAIRRLRIFVPPVSVQKSIIKELDSIQSKTGRMITDIEHQINLLHEYRTRLISDVVTGKLDVRDIAIPDYEAVEEVPDSTDLDIDETEGEDDAD